MTASPLSHLPSIPHQSRVSLLSEYLSLQQPDLPMPPNPPPKVASRIAARITLARSMDLSETPSEASLVDNALRRCATVQSAHSLRAEEARRRQSRILSQLYPTHPSFDSLLTSLRNSRHRASVLRAALREQSLALCKLSDAANLLLLVSDHVQVLISGYANPCPSFTSSEFSSDDESRRGCLFGSDDSRAHIYLSNLPPNFRVRYLRKCWGFAASALASAVDHSAFLTKQLERDGQTQLVPGIADKSRPSLSLFGLPGGVTVMFRPHVLRKMAADAKAMRETVFDWQMRQRKFLTRLKKDIAKANKTVSVYESRLSEARRRLLTSEFADIVAPA